MIKEILDRFLVIDKKNRYNPMILFSQGDGRDKKYDIVSMGLLCTPISGGDRGMSITKVDKCLDMAYSTLRSQNKRTPFKKFWETREGFKGGFFKKTITEEKFVVNKDDAKEFQNVLKNLSPISDELKAKRDAREKIIVYTNDPNCFSGGKKDFFFAGAPNDFPDVDDRAFHEQYSIPYINDAGKEVKKSIPLITTYPRPRYEARNTRCPSDIKGRRCYTIRDNLRGIFTSKRAKYGPLIRDRDTKKYYHVKNLEFDADGNFKLVCPQDE